MMSAQSLTLRPSVSINTSANFQESFTVGSQFLEEKFLDQHLLTTEAIRKGFKDFYYHYKKISLKKLKNKEIKELLIEYQSHFHHIGSYYKISQPEYLEPARLALEKFVLNIFYSSQVEKIVTILTTPRDMDVIVEEEMLALECSFYKKLSDEILWAYAERFPWLFCGMYNRKQILNSLQRKFASLSLLRTEERKKRLQSIVEDFQQKQKKYHHVLAECDNDRDIMYLASVFEKLALDRLKLKASLEGAEYLFLDLFEEVARRIGIPLQELMIYSVNDIVVFFNKDA